MIEEIFDELKKGDVQETKYHFVVFGLVLVKNEIFGPVDVEECYSFYQFERVILKLEGSIGDKLRVYIISYRNDLYAFDTKHWKKILLICSLGVNDLEFEFELLNRISTFVSYKKNADSDQYSLDMLIKML
ncbi:hypothetical protein [Pedobacter sp.]|uniref:hypothetical protein n=1 Tax=Pedobacter sp. TaxID=1411316 RepID=UPI003D7F3EE7